MQHNEDHIRSLALGDRSRGSRDRSQGPRDRPRGPRDTKSGSISRITDREPTKCSFEVGWVLRGFTGPSLEARARGFLVPNSPLRGPVPRTPGPAHGSPGPAPGSPGPVPGLPGTGPGVPGTGSEVPVGSSYSRQHCDSGAACRTSATIVSSLFAYKNKP